MVSFEKFRPQLRSGKIIPMGDRLIFETDDPFDQIILPIEMIDLLSQCNGEFTMGEIIENIYHRKGHVQFKAIYKTLLHLGDRGFLENGDELQRTEVKARERSLNFLTFKPIWNFYLGRRILNDSEHIVGFYLMAMAACVGAILIFQKFTPSWLTLDFLRAGDSYKTGFAFLFIGSSLLLSLKHIFKCILLLFLTGRAYNFGLTLNGFALYFKVSSDSLFLVSNRLFLLIFHIATTFCYFPLVALIYFFFPALPWQQEAYSLAVMLTLLEVNPFQDNEFTQFFKSFFNDDTLNKMSNYLQNRPLISIVNPFDRSRQKSLFVAFTHYATLWSAALYCILYHALTYHFESGTSALRTAAADEKLAVIASASVLATLGLVTALNVLRLIYLSLIEPIAFFFKKLIRERRSRKMEFFNSREVQKILEDLPLFNYFTGELLKTLVGRSEIRHFAAHAPILLQGDQGTHLYVLLSGALDVRQRQANGAYRKLGEVHPPSIFGEIAVLDETRASADVIAQRDSIVLMVPAKLLREISQDSQYIRELNAFKNAIMVNQYFTSAPLFRDLSDDVIHLFTARGIIENYKKDQIVFKQGDPGDGFYLLLRGSVGVLVNGRPVARIQQGGFFGEISMIADIPRTATVYALENVQVLKISREAFWEILSRDINMAMFIESVGEMRIREDIEVLKMKPPKSA